MGLDSVEIVMGWEAAFGIPIDDEEAFAIRTPRMAIDCIARKLGAVEGPPSACPTLRAFHRLRTSFMRVASIERRNFHPSARLKDLASRRQWSDLRATSGIASLPKPGLFSPKTVGELTRWVVTYALKDLKGAGEPWTRAEIRTIVRMVVAAQLGLKEFEDDDDFVRDLRVD